MQYRRITTAVLALVSVALVAACDDDDDDNPIGIGDENTTVRFINATTGSLNLDIAENGTVGSGNSNITFGGASSCLDVNNQNPQLAVRSAGTTTSLPGFAPSFAANNTYTVLVTGTAAAPVFTTFTDQFTAPTGNNALVRIINATTSATSGPGNWDIYVNPGATLGTPNATAVGRNSASNYLTVPAAQSNTIRLTNAGQTTAVLDISVQGMTAGTAQSILVTDAAAGTTTLRTFNVPACT